MEKDIYKNCTLDDLEWAYEQAKKMEVVRWT